MNNKNTSSSKTTTTTTSTTTTLSASTSELSSTSIPKYNKLNTQLFYKVWNNVILRNHIIQFIRLYNVYKNYKIMIDGEKIANYDNDYLYTSLKEHKDFSQRLFIRFDPSNKINNQLILNYINSKSFPKSIELLELYHAPHSDVILDLESSSNNEIQDNDTLVLLKGSIPSTIKSLIVNNVLIDQSNIVVPDSVQSLKFSYDFDTRRIKINCGIPLLSTYSNLKYLHMGFSYNDYIGENILPSSLEEIHFSTLFNHPLPPNVLPSNLKRVYFGSHYTQQLQVNSIPINVVLISFGSHYNRPLRVPEGLVIPSNVQTLSFGKRFNCPISDYNSSGNNSLVKSIYNKIKKNKTNGYYYLPASITSLCFRANGCKFEQKLDIANLNKLEKFHYCSIPKFERLPSNIKQIRISNTSSTSTTSKKNGFSITLSIPSNHFSQLSKLHLIMSTKTTIKTTLPNTLKSIKISNCIRLTDQSIPTSVNKIKGAFQHHIESIKTNLALVESITRLECSGDNHDLQRFINLKSVTFHHKTKSHQLPNSVKHLSYGVYNSPQQQFPESLTSLCRFGGEIPSHSLLNIPKSIKILNFKYIGRIDSSKLPDQLEILFLVGDLAILELPLPSSLHTIYILESNKFFFKDQNLINSISASCIIKVINLNYLNQIYKSIIKSNLN